MKDKAIYRKWWFWVVVAVIVIGTAGAFDDENKTDSNGVEQPQTKAENADMAKLPTINSQDYKGKEGLLVYKELKVKGYAVDAEFGNEALTDINGKASGVFEPLDPNREADRQSVDAFVISDLVQTGDSVKLTIMLKPN